jgi:hypothetical protein
LGQKLIKNTFKKGRNPYLHGPKKVHMSFSISGKLKVVGETQQIKDTFKKREFVLTDESSNYPQHISFQLVQDSCDLLDGIKEGEEVKVLFNLKGREWTSPQGELKHFNSLDAWRVERVHAGQEPAPMPAHEPPLPQEEDDLPF